jgi:hypothetical protein
MSYLSQIVGTSNSSKMEKFSGKSMKMAKFMKLNLRKWTTLSLNLPPKMNCTYQTCPYSSSTT